MGKYDDDSRHDLEEHLLGKDAGGTDDNGVQTPHTGNAAGNAGERAEHRESVKWRAQRGKLTFVLLRKHQLRIDIQKAFDELPVKFGRYAWQLLKRYGQPHVTGLLTLDKQSRWNNISIRQVGVSLESMVLLHGKINEVGAEQEVPKTTKEKLIKFLSCITFPPPLNERAVNELQRSSFLIAFGDADHIPGAAAGQPGSVGSPSLLKVTSAFDELWRVYSNQQLPSMRAAPPQVQNSGNNSNRVDSSMAIVPRAMSLECNVPSDNWQLPDDASEEWHAFSTEVQNNGGSMDTVQYAYEMSTIGGETHCWGCWGLGHRKSECPNPRNRDIKDVLASLTKRVNENPGRGLQRRPPSATGIRQRFLYNRSGGRGRGGGKGFGSRGGFGRGRGGRTFSCEVDEEGNAYDEDGEPMGYSLTANDAVETPSHPDSQSHPSQPSSNTDAPSAQTNETQLQMSSAKTVAIPPSSRSAAMVSGSNGFEMGICDDIPGFSLQLEACDAAVLTPDSGCTITQSSSRDFFKSNWHMHCEDVLQRSLPLNTSLPPESVYTMNMSIGSENNILYSGSDFDSVDHSIHLWNISETDIDLVTALGATFHNESWSIPPSVPFTPFGKWMDADDISRYDVCALDSIEMAEATRRTLPITSYKRELPATSRNSQINSDIASANASDAPFATDDPPDTSTADGSFIEEDEPVASVFSGAFSFVKNMIVIFLAIIAFIGRMRPGHVILIAFLLHAVAYSSAAPVSFRDTTGVASAFVFARALYPSAGTVNVYSNKNDSPRDAISQRASIFKRVIGFDDANPDSGTTKTASGNRKLFPTSLIRTWNPNLRVRVASNATMKVAFIGVMILPTRREPPPSTHAKAGYSRSYARELLSYHLGITDAMYVPGLAATLISTKGLFHNQNIRTYFNDDLYFGLPDGSKIHFNETPTHYSVWVDTSFDANTVDADTINAWATSVCPSVDQIHAELCHFSYERIAASATCTTGKNLAHIKRPADACPSCVRGGSKLRPAPGIPKNRYTRFGQRICADACSMPKSTPFGFEYLITMYDSATGYLAIYFTRTVNNAEFQLVFRQFIADNIEDLQYGRVEEFHCDNHGQFCSDNMDKFLAWLCTRQSTIVAWNPQQNPAECANRIVLRPLRIILAASNSSERTWPFGAHMVVMVHNSLASSSKIVTHPGLSPYQMKTMGRERKTGIKTPVGRVPNLSYFQVPYCRAECTVRAQRDITSKLAPRTVTCVHLGIDTKRCGYFMYVLAWQRFTTFRFAECTFFSNEFPRCVWITGTHLNEHGEHYFASENEQRSAVHDRMQTNQPDVGDTPTSDSPASGPSLGCSKCRFSSHGCAQCRQPGFIQQQRQPADPYDADGHQGPGVQGSREANVDTDGQQHGPIASKYPPRRLRSHDTASSLVCSADGIAELDDMLGFPLQMTDSNHVLCINLYRLTCKVDPPASFYEGQQGPYAKQWKDALVVHMTGKMANNCCEWVPEPLNEKIHKSKIVCTNKFNEDNSIEGWYARWVACGYSQQPGVHFDKTFTATAKMTAVRIFFNITLMLNLLPRRADVSKAFTRATIDTKLYVRQPEPDKCPGLLCKKKDKHGRYYVALLNKALEGLKQSGFLWQTLNTKILVDMGFTQLDEEPCLFMFHCGIGIIMALVWIDDYALGFSSKERETWFYHEYNLRDPDRSLKTAGPDGTFPPMLKNEGLLNKFIGMNIIWNFDKNTVSLSLSNTIERGVEKFYRSGVPVVKLPHTYNSSDRSSSFTDCGFAKDDAERKLVNSDDPYMSMTATALYYTTVLFGFCSHHTSVLSRYMADPNMACVKNVRTVLAYIYHMRDIPITYGGKRTGIPKPIESSEQWIEQLIRNFGMFVTCDGSWKVDNNYAGHFIFFQNAALDWSSRLVKVICMSSAEVEVCAGCIAAKRCMFIRSLFLRIAQFLGNGSALLQGPTLFLIDAEAAEKISQNPGTSKKIEHFLRWQHYLRWFCIHKHGFVIHNPGKLMIADPITKFTDATSFLRMVAVFTNNPKTLYHSKDFYTSFQDLHNCILRLQKRN